jgi:hypothetical protein
MTKWGRTNGAFNTAVSYEESRNHIDTKKGARIKGALRGGNESQFLKWHADPSNADKTFDDFVDHKRPLKAKLAQHRAPPSVTSHHISKEKRRQLMLQEQREYEKKLLSQGKKVRQQHAGGVYLSLSKKKAIEADVHLHLDKTDSPVKRPKKMQRKARIEALRIHQSRVQRKQALQEKAYRKAVQENVRAMESSSSGDSSSSEEDCEEPTGAGSKRNRVATPNRPIKKKDLKQIRSSKNSPMVAAFGGKTRYKMHTVCRLSTRLGLKYITCHAPFKHAVVFATAISLRTRSFRRRINSETDYRRKLEATRVTFVPNSLL